MHLQVSPFSMKCDAFQFEAQALLRAGPTGQFDSAARAHHTLPGQRAGRNRPEQPGDGPMVERVSGCRGHLPVRGDAALRNRQDNAPECRVTKLVGACSFSEDSTFQVSHSHKYCSPGSILKESP